MPAAGPQNTRARQIRQRRRKRPQPPPPAPSRRQIRNALAQRRGYVSQGKAVEKAASQQRRAAKAAPYVSQGRAVEKRATQLSRQTARQRRYTSRRVDPIDRVLKFLTSPAKLYGAHGPKRGGAGGSFASAQLFTPTEAKRFGGDVKTLAEGPFIGGYEAGLGGYEALIHGDTRRLRRLGKGVLEGTIHSVPGELVQGHPGRALKQFQEHPLIGLLDTAAGVSGVGRLAGAGARAARLSAGSTVRAPIALSEDAGAVREGAYVERRYSKDLTRKAVQVRSDRTREPLRGADGKVVTVRQSGRDVPVLRPRTVGERERLNRNQADFAASRANSVERHVRDVAAHEMRTRGIRGKRARDLVSMVVEGTVTSAKHFEEDLRAHRDRLEARLRDRPEDYRHSAERTAAEGRLKLVNDVLDSPRALRQAHKIVEAGTEIGRRLNEREREAIRLGLLDERAARRSKLVPAAIEHLGARHHSEEDLAALERAGHQVREPRAVARHQAARRAVTDAKRAHDDADRLVKQAKAKRDRLIGVQSSRRGTRAKSGDTLLKASGKATKAEQRKLERATEDLKAARRVRREKLAALRKAQRSLRRTPKPPLRASLRHGDGRFLSNDEIEGFLRSRGRDPETVAYLPHRLDVRGARAHHTQFRPGGRPVLDAGPTRTGSAYAKGVSEASTDLIRDAGVRQRTQIAKAKQIDRLVHDNGAKAPDGRYFTPKEAAEAAQRLEADTGERWVAMTAHGGRLSAETRRVIQEELQGPGAMESLSQRLLNDRIATPGDKATRSVVLVPAPLVEQLNRHLRPAGAIQKFFQFVNRPFRFAVLPQPRWLTGNFVEPFVVRLTTVGSGVNVFGLATDISAARRLIKRMERSGDPKVRAAAEELLAHQFGGLFVGGRGASVRRTAEDLPGPLKYGAVVRDLPVVKQGYDLLRVLPNTFFRFNRVIEAAAQHAALGKQVRRDVQEFTGSWLKTLHVQKAALDEAARGLTNTPTQRRFVRMQHELLGKYEGYPPWLREVIQGPMPFLPWTLNAARFVFWTLPAHRTIQTALLVKVNDVVAKDWKDIHSNTPPGSLRLAVPTKKGGWVDLARYTPWGFSGPIVEGDPQGATDQIAPQFSGALAALEGRDPFGRELQLDPSENDGETQPNVGQKAGIAANSLAEALIPFLSTARRLREGGGTGYAGSNIIDPDVKPGSKSMSAPRRVFDPFRPTYLSSPSGSTASSGGGGSRIDRVLQRRAELLAGQAAQDERLQAILERRARLLSP